MEWSIYFLIQYPEVQSKIHKELDDAVGRLKPLSG